MRILVAMALPMESAGRIERLQQQEGFDLLFTGVGKVNAAMRLGYALGVGIASHQPIERVINLGTAGSHHYPAHSLLNPIRFYQHDMQVEALGFEKGQTAFEDKPPLIYGENVCKIAGLSDVFPCDCHTGDHFVTDNRLDWAAMDMEAFALAKTCQTYQTPFICIKFVTDGADHSAAESWDQKLNAASEALAQALHPLINHLRTCH